MVHLSDLTLQATRGVRLTHAASGVLRLNASPGADILRYWLIQTIECFDSATNQEVHIRPADALGQQTLQQILEEFGRYDVNVTLKSF